MKAVQLLFQTLDGSWCIATQSAIPPKQPHIEVLGLTAFLNTQLL